MDAQLRQGIWEPQEGLELAAATLGIVGCGGIGRSLADIARASVRRSKFGIARRCLLLIATGRNPTSMGYSADTRHFFDGSRLARMKPGSILVNTARGGLVALDALIAALHRSDTVSHAALDVYDTEPLPPDDPLLTLPNLTLTAHAAFKIRAASRRLLEDALQLAGGTTSSENSG